MSLACRTSARVTSNTSSTTPSRASNAGRPAELGPEHEVDEYWLNLADGAWQDHGWHYPDGPGEWRGVRGPGDAFFAVAGGDAFVQVGVPTAWLRNVNNIE